VTDEQQRVIARETELSHPHWVVMWGCYTRFFWAFPRFGFSSDTIVSAQTPQTLLAGMQRVETGLRAGPHTPSYDPPAAALPRRVPLALRKGLPQDGAPHTGFSSGASSRWQAAEDDSAAPIPGQPALIPVPVQPRPARTNYDPYISGPLHSDGFDPDDPDWDLPGSFWPDAPQTSGPSSW
jgi:hypothetical protein